MHRDGVINIIQMLRSDLPPGLHRYKLAEQLRHTCFARRRRRAPIRSVICSLTGRPVTAARRRNIIRPQCHGCGYDLRGHESVLGPALPVGPLQCPECGKRYPAVW